jgi:hypothetical protein
MQEMFEEPMFTELVRGVLALALAVSLPFVIYFASPTGDALQAYQDALAAVVAFYFGTSSQPRS